MPVAKSSFPIPVPAFYERRTPTRLPIASAWRSFLIVIAALRSALFILWMAITVIPVATVVLIMSIFVRGDPVYWTCIFWLRLAIWGARFICGVRWRIQGGENLPTQADNRRAVILLSKHQSTWETFAYPALMTHPLAYVFKRELLYVPFFGWAMARMDMIHIDRSKRTRPGPAWPSRASVWRASAIG